MDASHYSIGFMFKFQQQMACLEVHPFSPLCPDGKLITNLRWEYELAASFSTAKVTVYSDNDGVEVREVDAEIRFEEKL